MKKRIKNTYDQKIEKKDKIIRSTFDVKWITLITLSAFFITIITTLLSEKIFSNVQIFGSVMVILCFVMLGVLFEMIGIAVASGEEKPFHSMATKKIKGSHLSIQLLKNAEKVSAFCNDVIGDICNIMSGTAGIVLANILADTYQVSLMMTTLFITSIIAAVTIGGKALGKSYAINKSELIVYHTAKWMTMINEKRK